MELFINRSKAIHGDIYNYSDVNCVNVTTKVNIICKKHGKFSQLPYSHWRGNGCPKCRISTVELTITRWLEENKINYIPQKSFSGCKNPKTNYPLKYDFFIPSLNTLIEYDGKQHFERSHFGKNFKTQKELEETQFRDKVKTEYSEKNGFNLTGQEIHFL